MQHTTHLYEMTLDSHHNIIDPRDHGRHCKDHHSLPLRTGLFLIKWVTIHEVMHHSTCIYWGNCQKNTNKFNFCRTSKNPNLLGSSRAFSKPKINPTLVPWYVLRPSKLVGTFFLCSKFIFWDLLKFGSLCIFTILTFYIFFTCTLLKSITD